MEVMDVNKFHTEIRIPKGIDISEPKKPLGPVVEKYPLSNHKGKMSLSAHPLSWHYLFIHHSKVSSFTKRMEAEGIVYFIHKTIVYQRKKQSRGIRTVEKATISGLVFMQGTAKQLQSYLDANFPGYYLVKNCSTRLPAVIPDSVMQPFMRVLDMSPERIRFLLHPFKYYAGGNIKLRITSGFLSGLEGYVIRIDRDRRLVMNVGGMSVAISGIHCEKFEVVEEEREKFVAASKSSFRRLTDWQQRIDNELYCPQSQSEIVLMADVLSGWQERATLYQDQGQWSEAKDLLFFLLEEMDFHLSTLWYSKTFDVVPLRRAARLISEQIDAMAVRTDYPEELREQIGTERDSCLSRFGYLFAE